MTESSQGVVFVCPPEPRGTLSLETRLSVGFGYVTVERDGERVWQGDNWQKKLKSVERQARREPGRWTVEFYGPMIGTTYERQARDEWVLIARNEGFA
jgi:hypothetical protein